MQQSVWVLDDNKNETGDHYRIALTDKAIECFVSDREAVHRLNAVSRDEWPVAIVADAYGATTKHLRTDTLKGYKECKALIEAMGDAKPEAVLFVSDDPVMAESCRKSAEVTPLFDGIKLFAASKSSGLDLVALMRGQRKRSNFFLSLPPEDMAIIRFVNALSPQDILPEEPREVVQLLRANGSLTLRSVLALEEDALLETGEAIAFIADASDRESFARGVISPPPALLRAEEGGLASFFAQRGRPVSGVVTFDRAGADLLLAQGKRPILFTRTFDALMREGLGGLTGAVVASGEGVGHLSVLSESHGFSILVGEQNCKESFPWGVKAGDDISLLDRPRPELVRGVVKGLDIETYESRCCLEQAGMVCNLFKKAGAGLTGTLPKFKANIDAMAQIEPAYTYGDGIGLVRTEHLIQSDPSLREAFVQLLCAPQDENKKSVFCEAYRAQTDLFWQNIQNVAGQSGKLFPIHVRLLDAPADEFLPEEIKTSNNLRGMRILDALPWFYDMQARVMCEGYLRHGRFGMPLGLMVPLVRTVDELDQMRSLVQRAAQETHLTDMASYSFGMMVETPEALSRIADFAPHVQFMSLGTNDLTAVSVGIERSDLAGQAAYETQNGFNPFVTLVPDLKQKLVHSVARAYDANPALWIDICGAHACDRESMRGLADKVQGLSMPPSLRNLVAHKADVLLDLSCERSLGSSTLYRSMNEAAEP